MLIPMASHGAHISCTAPAKASQNEQPGYADFRVTVSVTSSTNRFI
jgi:hypothetical protein